MPFGARGDLGTGDVLGEQAMLVRGLAEQCQRGGVTGRRRQAGVGEAFPMVRVDLHVAELTGSADIGDVPVVSVALAGLSPIGAHRLVPSPDAYALRRHRNRPPGNLVTDLGDHARQVTRIDQ